MPPVVGRKANNEPADVVMTDEPENLAEKNTYVSPTGKEDRTMVYPCYLNSKRTCQQGRKVDASIAVEEPLAMEIYEACRKLELNAMVEPFKIHPRDWGTFGRVRVELFDTATKTPHNASITTRKALLREIARTIPTLESRTNPPKLMQPTIQHHLGLVPIPAHLLQLMQQQMLLAEQQQMPAPAAPPKSGKKGRKK